MPAGERSSRAKTSSLRSLKTVPACGVVLGRAKPAETDKQLRNVGARRERRIEIPRPVLACHRQGENQGAARLAMVPTRGRR